MLPSCLAITWVLASSAERKVWALEVAKVSQSVLECCSGCIASMGLVVEQRPTKVTNYNEQSSLVTGKGVSGIDIMTKDATELAGDFHSRISDGRKIKGMSQEDLARSMNVKIGVIQKAENGNRPMDSTLEKFEKALGFRFSWKPYQEAIPWWQMNHRVK